MLVVETLSRNEILNQNTYCYNYRMFKNEILLSCEGQTSMLQSYGIEIERQDILNGVVVGIERNSVSNISPHRHKVHNLIKMLYDNLVSPIHLVDIVGEYTDEYSTDYEEAQKEAAYN